MMKSQDHDKRKSRRIMSASASLRTGSMSIAFMMHKDGFKTPKYQNSYRLWPRMPFSYKFADKILVEVMHENLDTKNLNSSIQKTSFKYDTQNCSRICTGMASEIRNKLFRTDYDRVKYVVIVTIIENKDQGVASQIGRLWDTERDTYSCYVYEAPTFYAVGTIFAIYYE